MKLFYGLSIASLICLLSMPLVASAGNASCEVTDDGAILGMYRVVDVVRYRGGLTSKERAEQWVGKTASFTSDLAKTPTFSIAHPKYLLRCFPVSHEEGEVPTTHWLNFYGFGVDRSAIEVFEIYDPKDSDKYPYSKIEVVDGELWETFDGWLIKLRRSSRQK